MMELIEKNLREIIATTQHALRKEDERFSLEVIPQPERDRYVVHVLMGRREFEEHYPLFFHELYDDFWCRDYCKGFAHSILTNL
jgi:hypothetical protein